MNSEKSSSIRNETAQKLVSSVYYTVGVYFKTLSPVGAALKEIKNKMLVCFFGELPEYALSQLMRQYPNEDLLSDERDKEIYNTLRAFLSALPPEKLVRIMNGAAD